MLKEDMDILAGRAMARLFSVMVQVAQETVPVGTTDTFRERVHDLVVDLPIFLDSAQGDPESPVRNEQATYDRDAVALVVKRGVSDLSRAFDGSGENARDAMRTWWREYGDRDHTVAWLIQQAASFLVADATMTGAERC
ncbi:hypothetical protein HFQ13_09630 [Acidithiobacillus sp. VAN18-1]|uniref:Uncharacterized protein n=1 Tax=Igneacidithiobacillus copahuensis TaxID=2724909 RepID=A0AAE3CK31_9PROT|nr:hypothetical protein [Igneacidithiobacillus copahuensis]MBU2788452.1 hypothetical protein [Igneacidithiobacillus copahuensis]MBU2796908.1 hypothetical protein [Acidithiobacillus sp. VAN18-2]